MIGKQTQRGLLIVGTILLIAIGWYFSNILLYIILAAILAAIGKPILNTIEKIPLPKERRVPRTISTILTMLIMGAVLLGGISFLFPPIASEVAKLSGIDMGRVIEYINSANEQLASRYIWFGALTQDSNIIEIIQQEITSLVDLSDISNIIGSIVEALGGIMILLFSVTFILFFFLKEETMFKNSILLLIPTQHEAKGASIMESISHLLHRYILGIFYEVIAILILDVIGFSIVGIPFNQALVIALVAAIMNVIPYIGPWIGAAFGVLLAISSNIESSFIDITLPLITGILIVVVVVQVLDNVLFQPLIYSTSVKAHPLEIFLVIMMAGSMFGVLGMILAVPVYTILRVIAGEFLSQFKIVKKITANMK